MLNQGMTQIFFAASILLGTLFSCSGGDDTTIPTPEPGPQQIIPSNLELIITINGADTNNPNGDGSGVIRCKASADNATSYSFRFGTGDIIDNTTGEVEYEFNEKGINPYTVTVLAYSSTGNSISTSQDITIAVSTVLLWSEEFNVDGAPDDNNWNFEIGNGCPNLCGWGNNESQYYTSRTDNVIVEGGFLKITAKKESYQGYEYTSTRMKTQGKFDFTYGKVEVRAKLPQGGGTWPAIWMLGSNITTVGWPTCGEIDIMEHVGNNLGTVSSALHTPSSSGATVNTGEKLISNVSTEFHVYGLDWTEEKMDFSIDGIVFYTYNPANKNDSTWPFYQDQFLLLNIAMGGGFGGAIDPAFTQSTMEVDYIRVYQ